MDLLDVTEGENYQWDNSLQEQLVVVVPHHDVHLVAAHIAGGQKREVRASAVSKCVGVHLKESDK